MTGAAELLVPRYVLPIRPAHLLLEQHAVRISDGQIDDILPVETALERYANDKLVSLPDHVLMPGLVNAHTHSPMSLLRGIADDVSLDVWLKERIWPLEARWVSESFVRDGTYLAMAEMLRGGITTFCEMYFFPEVIAEVSEGVGMRALLGAPVIDVKTPWASGLDECLLKAQNLIDQVADNALCSPVLAPHAPYTVDDTALDNVRRMSEKQDVRIAMHVLETAWEIEFSRETYGMGTLERLASHGLLNERFMAVHMTHLDEDDIQRVKDARSHVIHCPVSNLKLASGVSPVSSMLKAEINVALGTDGAASNNSLDLLAEAKTAALLAKGYADDPCVLNAWESLDLLTINGARALGLEDKIGTIESGKQADLVAMNLNCVETQPLHNVHSQIVYAASSRQFSHSWVAGRLLMADGELVGLDLAEIVSRAQSWQAKMGSPV